MVCLLVGLTLLAVAGCARQKAVPHGDTDAAAAMSKPHVGAGVPDLSRVRGRAHFAFRAQGQRFVGGHTTYAVEASDGTLQVTPRAGGTRGATLTLTRAAIVRGGTRAPAGALTLGPDGALASALGAVRQSIENRESGVEIAWSFPERPLGAGALEVRLETAGLEPAGVTRGGAHFLGAPGGLGVRVGHGTWIDAKGLRTPVLAALRGRDVVFSVPAELVEASHYPAVLDPIVGPETAIDAPVTSPAAGDRGEPSMASSGSQSFVVWSDLRGEGLEQLFGTRISATGVVLDPLGIAVSPPLASVDAFAVAYDGTNYLVVWGTGSAVVGRRFNSGGSAVDSEPFTIHEVYFPFNLRAASNGSQTLVGWMDRHTGFPAPYAKRLSGATVLDSDPLAIATTTADTLSPLTMAAVGSSWLLAWSDLRNGSPDIFASRIQSSTGTVLDPSGFAVAVAADNQRNPVATSNGTDFFLVWSDDRDQDSDWPSVYGARVTAAGTVVDGSGIRLCNDSGDLEFPSVAYAGGTYQVVWDDIGGNAIHGNRVNATNGALLDGAAGAVLQSFGTSTILNPTVFSTGAAFYLTWREWRGDAYGYFLGSRLTTAKVLLDVPGVELAKGGNSQLDVDLAGDGNDRYYVVWEDTRSQAHRIYGARLDGNGTPLDATGVPLSAEGVHSTSPAVAFNGTHFLVVWDDLSGVRGTRINATTGAALEAGGVTLFARSAGNAPYVELELASDGNGWFAVWDDTRLGSVTIYGGRVNASLGVLDSAGFEVSTVFLPNQAPRLAFGGGNYLVSWNAGNGVYATRVSPAGAVLDGSGIPLVTNPHTTDVGATDVAYSSPNFVVAYPEDNVLKRARVSSATGQIVDRVTLAPSSTFQPALAFDGNSFVLVYGQPGTYGQRDLNLAATRLDANGADIDANDYSIVSTAGVEPAGASVAAFGGKALIAYAKYDPTLGVTATRLRTRLFDSLASGTGGAAGTAGTAGASGTAGTSGGAGGTTGGGGTTSAGGTTSKGGTSSAGGTSSGGGTTGTGGAGGASVGTGGVPANGGSLGGAGEGGASEGGASQGGADQGGRAEDGGASGVGGATATSGSSGMTSTGGTTSGSAGHGGFAGGGRAAGGTGGGAGKDTAPPTPESGCGCRVVPARNDGVWSFWLLALVTVFGARLRGRFARRSEIHVRRNVGLDRR
jgi:hypothetical protein